MTLARFILPLVLVVGCVSQSVSPMTYRMIVTSQYTGYSFTSYHQQIIQNRVNDLGMSPKVTVVCPETACPNLACAGRSFSFFQSRGCSLVSATSRSGLTLQNSRTYVEYVFIDTNPGAAVPFANRVATANTRVATSAAIADPTIVNAGVTNRLPGVAVTPVPAILNVTPTPSDDDIAGKWWFWFLLCLLLLCCCCIAIYLLFFRKKRNKNKQNKAKEQPYNQEMGRMFVPGDSVDALYDDKWFGATVLGGNTKEGYSLEWDDGSLSDNVNPSDMRLKRTPQYVEQVSPAVSDAAVGIGQPVVALSGGKYHSGVIRSVRGDSVMVEKANGSLQQFHAGSLQRDIYNEQVISARSGSPVRPVY